MYSQPRTLENIHSTSSPLPGQPQPEAYYDFEEELSKIILEPDQPLAFYDYGKYNVGYNFKSNDTRLEGLEGANDLSTLDYSIIKKRPDVSQREEFLYSYHKKAEPLVKTAQNTFLPASAVSALPSNPYQAQTYQNMPIEARNSLNASNRPKNKEQFGEVLSELETHKTANDRDFREYGLYRDTAQSIRELPDEQLNFEGHFQQNPQKTQIENCAEVPKEGFEQIQEGKKTDEKDNLADDFKRNELYKKMLEDVGHDTKLLRSLHKVGPLVHHPNVKEIKQDSTQTSNKVDDLILMDIKDSKPSSLEDTQPSCYVGQYPHLISVGNNTNTDTLSQKPFVLDTLHLRDIIGQMENLKAVYPHEGRIIKVPQTQDVVVPVHGFDENKKNKKNQNIFDIPPQKPEKTEKAKFDSNKLLHPIQPPVNIDIETNPLLKVYTDSGQKTMNSEPEPQRKQSDQQEFIQRPNSNPAEPTYPTNVKPEPTVPKPKVNKYQLNQADVDFFEEWLQGRISNSTENKMVPKKPQNTNSKGMFVNSVSKTKDDSSNRNRKNLSVSLPPDFSHVSQPVIFDQKQEEHQRQISPNRLHSQTTNSTNNKPQVSPNRIEIQTPQCVPQIIHQVSQNRVSIQSPQSDLKETRPQVSPNRIERSSDSAVIPDKQISGNRVQIISSPPTEPSELVPQKSADVVFRRQLSPNRMNSSSGKPSFIQSSTGNRTESQIQQPHYSSATQQAAPIRQISPNRVSVVLPSSGPPSYRPSRRPASHSPLAPSRMEPVLNSLEVPHSIASTRLNFLPDEANKKLYLDGYAPAPSVYLAADPSSREEGFSRREGPETSRLQNSSSSREPRQSSPPAGRIPRLGVLRAPSTDPLRATIGKEASPEVKQRLAETVGLLEQGSASGSLSAHASPRLDSPRESSK